MPRKEPRKVPRKVPRKEVKKRVVKRKAAKKKAVKRKPAKKKAAKRKAVKRVDKREARARRWSTWPIAKAKYSPNSKFPRADQRRITVNLDADSYEKLRIASATKRKRAGKIIDELVQGYIDRIKEDKPAYLQTSNDEGKAMEETVEAIETAEDLDSLVRKTYLQRVKARVFADIGVHLNEGQIVNYCLNLALSRTNEKRED